MDKECFPLLGRNLLDSLWFSQPLHPLQALGNGSAQVLGVRTEGWAKGWAVKGAPPPPCPEVG